MDFSPYAAVLLDLDGTVYHEDHALPGATGLIHRLQETGVAYACLTNSTSSPSQLAERLARMGVTVDPAHVYTAANAACDYVLQELGHAGDDNDDPARLPRVYNLASEGVAEMLDGRVQWVRTGGEPCDAVIVGTPTNPYAADDRRRVALQLLRRTTARLVGICADRVYPSPRGIEFGSGALSHFLAYAANTPPVFAGKPNRIFFEELCTRLGVLPDLCLMIGDNLEADIAGGKTMGMKTVLTLSGVTRRRDLLKVPEAVRPDWVVEDLTEL
jgi:HAD superfamily hydrolase (TIGR01450 family)